MNFLQLCKRVRREAGISGDGPSTVTSQVGMILRIVEWTQEAYSDICAMPFNWKFLRTDMTFATTVDQNEYSIEDDLLITDLAKFDEDLSIIYETDEGTDNQSKLVWFEYRKFRDRFRTYPDGRPTHVTLPLNGENILLNALPQEAYTIALDYWKVAPALTANTDEPLFPERFHMLVVWEAVKKYAGQDSVPELWKHASNQASPLRSGLIISQGELPIGTRNASITQPSPGAVR